MTTLFLTCAVIGGTVLICQFVLSVVGLTDHGAHLVDDLPSSGDVHLDSAHGHAGDGGDASPGHSHLSDWFFGVLSFRTIIAFLTFFGLAGMAANSGGMSVGGQFVIALASGLGAMYATHGLMAGIRKLAHDGTLRIERAIGTTGTVYLPIPANRANTGKVHVTVQQRQMEFNAVTPVGARLPAGAKVIVTGIIGGDTLEVEPLPVEKPTDVPAPSG